MSGAEIRLAEEFDEAILDEEFVDPIVGTKVFCALCGTRIRVNQIVRISFCPIHGLEAPFARFG
jgi:hypothetical protein